MSGEVVLSADLVPCENPAEVLDDNGQLMLKCRELGYIRDTDRVLDPTYGNGTWWKHFRPANLVAHDLDPEKAPDGPMDFRKMDYGDGRFDVAAYDPPYVAVGGKETSTLDGFHANYGLLDCSDPDEVQQRMHDGLTEMGRVVRPRGVVLAKAQDYISSGKLWEGSYKLRRHAEEIGLECVDRLELVAVSTRAQPGDRTRKHDECDGKGCDDCDDGRVPSKQMHSRRNYSTLFVFRTPSLRARNKAAQGALPL